MATSIYDIIKNGRLDRKDTSSSAPAAVYNPPVRSTADITTSTLPTGDTWTGIIPLSAAYRLYAIQTSQACRVRLYISSATLAADASRAIGTDPADDSGLMLEFVSTASLTGAVLSPLVDGFVSDGTANAAISITNAGISGTVTVTLTYISTEE